MHLKPLFAWGVVMKTNVLLFFSQDLFYRSVVPTQPTTVPLSLNIYIYINWICIKCVCSMNTHSYTSDLYVIKSQICALGAGESGGSLLTIVNGLPSIPGFYNKSKPWYAFYYRFTSMHPKLCR